MGYDDEAVMVQAISKFDGMPYEGRTLSLRGGPNPAYKDWLTGATTGFKTAAKPQSALSKALTQQASATAKKPAAVRSSESQPAKKLKASLFDTKDDEDFESSSLAKVRVSVGMTYL